jgi:hypothetical protein
LSHLILRRPHSTHERETRWEVLIPCSMVSFGVVLTKTSWAVGGRIAEHYSRMTGPRLCMNRSQRTGSKIPASCPRLRSPPQPAYKTYWAIRLSTAELLRRFSYQLYWMTSHRTGSDVESTQKAYKRSAGPVGNGIQSIADT